MNTSKRTSVHFLYDSDPPLRIQPQESNPEVCRMIYEFEVSTVFSIAAEVVAGRVVGDLVSVITKVLHKHPSKTFKFTFFDAAGAD